MNALFVVSDKQDWPDDVSGASVVLARTYLMDSTFGDLTAIRVINLCSSYCYQSEGYYVSLLAEARGQHPLPDVQSMKALHAGSLQQEVKEKLGDLIEGSFAKTAEDVVELHVCFGRDAERRYSCLSEQLFKLLHLPLLHARFERTHGAWLLRSLDAGHAGPASPHWQPSCVQAALEYLNQGKAGNRTTHGKKRSLAILHEPESATSPSNGRALRKFQEAAQAVGLHAELVTHKDAWRLENFDALFIRATTNVNHYTYTLSRQAADAGLVVIDDPESILRCTNKIYLHELLARHHLPTPKTMVVHADNLDRVVPALGLPCVLKQPDGAFSQGVLKMETDQQLRQEARNMLRQSALVLAQEYLPTAFDWRVGVLDRRPLFVCRYYMAPGHWQVIKHEHQGICEGRIETLSVGEAPDEVVAAAVHAANLIGDGFYGVDLKQIGAHTLVMEINDNPNIDAGNEDAVLTDALYREVMGVFRKRIESRNGG